MIRSQNLPISVVVIACVVYWLVERPETLKQSNGAEGLIHDIVQGVRYR
ncbi:MAG: hypothetical protein OEQ14_14685 [Gammaproteobacteria bacterium]|nr:hypothetical protein [Gammaproteobacteria bacterium]